ncbi:hypothetical protein TNCV_853081 [Trichonephila clavipes]|nr:hypothetical protein TNCV_853081 [Trichonephila clavipes]
MYGRANGNGRAAQQIYHAQFPERRITDRNFSRRLHHQLREKRSFLATRHDAGRRTQSKPGRKHLERCG